MQTTFGELTPPLGTHRLKVVELLGTLVNARYVSVYATLLDTDVLSTLLVRFFLLVFIIILLILLKIGSIFSI